MNKTWSRARITPENAKERFYAKVIKTDGCWLWTGWKNKKGYGVSYAKKADGSRILFAHRAAFYFKHGREAIGLVCHKCDNPPCVRPDHLYDGTIEDNARDRRERGVLSDTCAKGHPRDVNLRIYGKNKKRTCRECGRASSREHYRKGGDMARMAAADKARERRASKFGYEVGGREVVGRGCGWSKGSRRKVCLKGHAYPADVRINSKGRQECAICTTAQKRRYREMLRSRAALAAAGEGE